MEEENIENIVLDVVDINNVLIVESLPKSADEHKTYLTSLQYGNDNNRIMMKLPEIRETLKFYKNSMVIPLTANNGEKRQWKQAIKNIHDFTLMGTKQVLLERLRAFYIQDLAAGHIQRRVRGFFVRFANYLRGPAQINRSMCVNATDFYTMDPLNEIAYIDFISYTDNDNFTYGFDINSLIEYANKSRRQIKNPYTRDNMETIIQDMKKLYRLNRINSTFYVPPPREVIKIVKQPRRQNTTPVSRRHTHTNPRVPPEYDSAAMIRFIRERRSKPIEERLRLIFMEIDQLGNYTQMSWVSNLEIRDYNRFFRILKDIWTYRAQLSHSIKIRICPLWDPFMILAQNGIRLASFDVHQWLNLTVSIMEDMVCTGVDIEHKTLGSFHVLSALTIVSRPARLAMPWLYESLIW